MKFILSLLLCLVSFEAVAARYAVINGQDVVNIIDWDGVSPYTPTPGTYLVPVNTIAAIGGTYVNGVFIAPPVPPLTPAQQLLAKINAGMQTQFTSNPSLNSTYAIDVTTQQRLMAIALYISVNHKFPNNNAPLKWPNITGVDKTFTDPVQFVAFASAIGDYVTALEQGGNPSQPVVIP